jgi:hypothetical protein
MKVLTICQPYAELIARGDKRIENRKRDQIVAMLKPESAGDN